MVRLAVSVEGQTEESFIKKVITPHFQERQIYVTPIQRGGRGGDVSLSRIRRDLNLLANSFDKVTTLYDFYGFRGKADDETKESLEEKIRNAVADPLRHRIIPYIQMYEFEGILFSSPQAMADCFQEPALTGWADRILAEFNNDPERINDSKQTAPSKRLQNRTQYIKTVHGPDIAKDIGLSRLREKCSGFNHWIGQKEALQQ